jgi:23S rRNA (cytidine2498-2'-O)-methyltransferase
VEIHRTLAQTYLSSATEPFALIVDDMRLDARESAEIMVQAVGLLEAGGVGLMTFKLPERAPTGVIRQAQAVLRRAFPQQEARCLYYNRREITVCLRREGL